MYNVPMSKIMVQTFLGSKYSTLTPRAACRTSKATSLPKVLEPLVLGQRIHAGHMKTGASNIYLKIGKYSFQSSKQGNINGISNLNGW